MGRGPRGNQAITASLRPSRSVSRLQSSLRKATEQEPRLGPMIYRAEKMLSEEPAANQELAREVIALAAAGIAEGAIADQWQVVVGEVAARLREIGLDEEASEIERQQLVDISSHSARSRYQRAFSGDSPYQAPARCLPPDVVIYNGDFDEATRHYVFAHELAHKISFLRPALEDHDNEDGGWLMAEPFNDLRAIQLVDYSPGQMRPTVDACLEVAYGLTRAAGLSPRQCLVLSDKEMEEQLAAGLGLSFAQWREQVVDPFDEQISSLQQQEGTVKRSSDLLTSKMPEKIRQLVRRYGPDFTNLGPIRLPEQLDP